MRNTVTHETAELSSRLVIYPAYMSRTQTLTYAATSPCTIPLSHARTCALFNFTVYNFAVRLPVLCAQPVSGSRRKFNWSRKTYARTVPMLVPRALHDVNEKFSRRHWGYTTGQNESINRIAIRVQAFSNGRRWKHVPMKLYKISFEFLLAQWYIQSNNLM